MLRTWIADVMGRLKQLGSHADGLEEENRRLKSELSSLLAARRDNDVHDSPMGPGRDRAGRHRRLGTEPPRRASGTPGVREAVSRSQDDPSDRRPRYPGVPP
jgi:hypothetical protein